MMTSIRGNHHQEAHMHLQSSSLSMMIMTNEDDVRDQSHARNHTRMHAALLGACHANCKSIVKIQEVHIISFFA